MLKTLYIENIAVIEKTSIDFSGGLNVLTGETGAGKSIIIDAINAIMGQRTSRDIIRTGEKTAFVSALFEDVNPTVQKTLAGLGFEAEDGTLLLQRSLSLSGKSSCKELRAVLARNAPRLHRQLRRLSGIDRCLSGKISCL